MPRDARPTKSNLDGVTIICYKVKNWIITTWFSNVLMLLIKIALCTKFVKHVVQAKYRQDTSIELLKMTGLK